MKTFKIILLFVFSIMLTFCSSKSDKELFDNAQTLLTEKKYDEAVVIFEELVEQNKDSDMAPRALFECAKVYQGKVVKNLGAKESSIKSVDVYKKIFNNYPSSTEAENSLFMAGFILANDLQDFDAAKETYELYIEKYPDGQLADDAKIELENLGKTPEEILLEKIHPDMLDEKAS
jgi:TolA-binding protein